MADLDSPFRFTVDDVPFESAEALITREKFNEITGLPPEAFVWVVGDPMGPYCGSWIAVHDGKKFTTKRHG